MLAVIRSKCRLEIRRSRVVGVVVMATIVGTIVRTVIVFVEESVIVSGAGL